MHHLPSNLIIPLIALLLNTLAGCSDSKESQCSRLVDLLKKGGELAHTFDINDAKAANQVALDLDAFTQKLKAVKVEDPNLQDFHKRFLKIYQDLSVAFRDTAPVITLVQRSQSPKPSLQQLKEAQTKVKAATLTVKQATIDAAALEGDINRYCGAATP